MCVCYVFPAPLYFSRVVVETVMLQGQRTRNATYYINLTNFITFSYQDNNSITVINILQPTGHVMHQQFNIQQLYVLPTLYLCILYLSEN